MASHEQPTVTIANGGTVSSVLRTNGKRIAGIDLGPTLTSTALSIQNSVDGATYRAAYDSAGAAVSWTVAGGRYLRFDPPLCGYVDVKFVAGSAEGAARTLTVCLVP
jgi:YD repeat-containing protein